MDAGYPELAVITLSCTLFECGAVLLMLSIFKTEIFGLAAARKRCHGAQALKRDETDEEKGKAVNTAPRAKGLEGLLRQKRWAPSGISSCKRGQIGV